MLKVSRNMTLGKIDKRRGLFLPNTDNFLAFFIVFEWGRIFEYTTKKREVKYNAKLRPNYISVHVSVLAVVFRQPISKKPTFLSENVSFFKFVSKIQAADTKRIERKIIRT